MFIRFFQFSFYVKSISLDLFPADGRSFSLPISDQRYVNHFKIPVSSLQEFYVINVLRMWQTLAGSFENEALENEERSMKHPNLENEAPKTRKRSTQISKTKLLNQVEAADASAPSKVHKIHPKVL